MIPNFNWTMTIVLFSTIVCMSLCMPYLIFKLGRNNIKAVFYNNSEYPEVENSFPYKQFYYWAFKICLIFTFLLVLPFFLIDYFKQKDFYECEQQGKEMIYINKHYKCVDKDLAEKYINAVKEVIIAK